MTAPKKNIGLIGLGYWGKNLLRCLYETGALHTACDSSPAIIAQRSEQYPEVTYTDSIEVMLETSELKAVVISAPAVKHYELARQFLLAGKDVFVEKPLALTAAQGQELVELGEEQQRVLMVGHILNYHPAVIKLKELIASGELGKIQYIYSNRLNIGKLRTEENILWSFAPHDISVMLALLGEEPVRVTATGGAYLSGGIYDTTLSSLEFAGGVRGHIFVSWLHPFKEQKLIVVGSRSMAVFDDMTAEKLFIYPHQINWMEGKIPVAQKAEHVPVPLEKSEPLKNEIEHFIDCITTRRTPRTDGREGLRVLKVLEQAEQSLLQSNSTAAPQPKDCFIHEHACIDQNVRIGAETKIWHFSHILSDTTIGARCIIGQNTSIGPNVTIGDGCKIQNNVSVYPGVTLEDNVFCGPSCVFTNVYNPRAFIERKHEFLETRVGTGATIGANATIVCGNAIGKYALIAAGAVVKQPVPAYAVVAGVPARQVGWACKCGVTLKLAGKKAECGKCGSTYEERGSALTPLHETV